MTWSSDINIDTAALRAQYAHHDDMDRVVHVTDLFALCDALDELREFMATESVTMAEFRANNHNLFTRLQEEIARATRAEEALRTILVATGHRCRGEVQQ